MIDSARREAEDVATPPVELRATAQRFGARSSPILRSASARGDGVPAIALTESARVYRRDRLRRCSIAPSTESDDRGAKLDRYKMIASVQAVILIAQDRAQVIVHERQADGSFTQSDHDDGAIELPAINCTLPIAEVYEDLPIAST
jgi:hypothetical protein